MTDGKGDSKRPAINRILTATCTSQRDALRYCHLGREGDRHGWPLYAGCWSCPAERCVKRMLISRSAVPPIDARGLTIISRPAGRPSEMMQSSAQNMGRRCRLPFTKCGAGIRYSSLESDYTEHLVTSYANRHRHSCIGAGGLW